MSSPENEFNIPGLSTQQVLAARGEHGSNTLTFKKKNGILSAIVALVKEPMIILLLVAAAIYIVSGSIGDGVFLIAAIFVVSALTLYQDSRSRNALEKLKTLTQPRCKVIRDNVITETDIADIVIGDSVIVEEGTSVPADGIIVHANDFTVNESILTGESLAVSKNQETDDNKVYMGSTVVSGLAVATITAIGNNTRLGKIGKSLEAIKAEKTPLELQINNFVKKLAFIGLAVFLIVWGLNYFRSHEVLDSLLKALTLAMSIMPEEIPMAFTTFMAIGAWRLAKEGVVVKQMKTVETLGSATVICTDKTGTITENEMSLARLFVLSSDKVSLPGDMQGKEEEELISLAMWASEPAPFDPMEIALHNAYAALPRPDERPDYKFIHEYPLSGKPPMMTHIWEHKDGKRIIAAKGAPEALIAVSDLTDFQKSQIQTAIQSMAADGFRLLAVGVADHLGQDFPDKQQQFRFHFKGIVAFYDPPKKNIQSVLTHFYDAGIAVKIITGDNAITTAAIAKQIAFRNYDKTITGDQLMLLSETQLQERVMDTGTFTRMFPEAKLKIINALKAQQQIVAMTGDGVNDGPALKAAHIGIAMGKKGTEIARQAASVILTNDDLSAMVTAIAMGRSIYTNLKKAIRYIISIHIPIILTVFFPLALGWVYPNIFTPLHIIFLELIMGPTCSIAFENEPPEKNIMQQPPRPYTTSFFSLRELSVSILQGLVITAGTLFTYQYAIAEGYGEQLTRTMIFTVLISANILLTFVNRSFYYSVLTTLRYRNNILMLVAGITICLSAILLYVPPIRAFFGFDIISGTQLLISVGIASISVLWFEIVKWTVRLRSKVKTVS